MAGIIGGGIQSLFAAFAFSGAGLLLKHLDKNAYEAEAKRHNRALEDLTRAKEQFYENEVKQHDRIQELRQQLADANHDIEDTNKALDMLRQVRTIRFKNTKFDREPRLSDFYKPNEEMRDYQYLVMGGLGVGAGYLIYKMA